MAVDGGRHMIAFVARYWIDAVIEQDERRGLR
jgi:hypothetical protein